MPLYGGKNLIIPKTSLRGILELVQSQSVTVSSHVASEYVHSLQINEYGMSTANKSSRAKRTITSPLVRKLPMQGFAIA